MIYLFDKYDDVTKDLHQSFKLAGYDNVALVLDDNGHLPEGVLSPYQYFQGEENPGGIPRYFNQIDKPELWEIDGNSSQASIHDYHHLRARIFYAEPARHRFVRTVEWLDEKEIVRSIDYYNRYGRKYAHTIFSQEGKSIFTTYFHVSGKEAIVENHLTGGIILTFNGKNQLFTNKINFLHYFFEVANIDCQSIVYNRLSLPFLLVYNLQQEGQDWIIWQEELGDEIPGNMLAALKKSNRQTKILVPEHTTYQKMKVLMPGAFKDSVLPFGYIYEYQKTNQQLNKALIATNSDEIEQLETLVKELPELEFHIVALTEMSSKLMSIGNYPNVTLYPNVTQDKMASLWDSCFLLLDINHYGEILEASREAFNREMVIAGFTNTVHHPQYMSSEALVNSSDYPVLVAKIRQWMNSKQDRENIVLEQKKLRNEVSVETFKNLFEH